MGSRRQFIKQGTFVFFASQWPFMSYASSGKKTLGVALTGLGSYSTHQLGPSLKQTEHCELRGIITGSPGKIPGWQKEYGIADAHVYDYGQMDQLANDDGIDVVYVVLPNAMHAEYAVRAAEAGKHVWCEKPMALNVEQCERIIEACEKNGVSLSIGYRMQHEPNTRQLMKWAKEETFGPVQSAVAEAGFHFRGDDPSNWRLKKEMGGGALYDMGVYCINAARYATGKEPEGVEARVVNRRGELFTEVDETTEFTLYFKNDLRVSCTTSFGENLNRLEVQCRDGNYYLRPMQSYTGVQGGASDGTRLEPIKGKQQVLQMQDDARSIINNTPVMVPGEEGLKDIRIVEAIQKSVKLGSKYVQI
ncbi:Gfo/Idh/MocA family protein [Robertkochia flava]|uniref:Gfo/Idh/MocA family protein n=1 Tax=Robertkochia flava TaxID=3447986 RepID=UPI001CCC17A2|nr:Gfo/Idh/MocA family oxidoreductase [Robertkochia marina]